MQLYDKNGYLDMRTIMELPTPYIWIYGGRATGKTYGALKYLFETGTKFLLLRRTQTQVDTISIPDFAPYRKLDAAEGWQHNTRKVSKYLSGIYEGENPLPCAYMAALSTIANIRGFAADDIEVILYDEFIPERHEKRMSHEYEALQNAYETINRNRELEGRPPVKLIGLANTNDFANPVFMGFGLIREADKARKKGAEMWITKDKRHTLISTHKSPISAAKAETVQYQGVSDAYSDMAIHGKFVRTSSSRIRSMPLAEYDPLVTVGEVTVYRHKSRREYYCTSHASGTCQYFAPIEIDLQRFRAACGWLMRCYMQDLVIFDEELSEILLTRYMQG